MVKRAWLRIVEASIAILIIFSVLLIINNRNQQVQTNDLSPLITPMLEEIARNVTFRDQIVNQGTAAEPALKNFVSKHLTTSTIKYDVKVCEINDICSLAAYPANTDNVYASERVISSTITTYKPRKVKIFLWQSNA